MRTWKETGTRTKETQRTSDGPLATVQVSADMPPAHPLCGGSSAQHEQEHMPKRTFWDEILDELRADLMPEEIRRWFGESMQAGDSGDQVTVWVPSETVRRHIMTHYQDLLDSALVNLGRTVEIRFVATGVGEDEDEDLNS